MSPQFPTHRKPCAVSPGGYPPKRTSCRPWVRALPPRRTNQPQWGWGVPAPRNAASHRLSLFLGLVGSVVIVYVRASKSPGVSRSISSGMFDIPGPSSPMKARCQVHPFGLGKAITGLGAFR